MKKPNIQVWENCYPRQCMFNGETCPYCGIQASQAQKEAYQAALAKHFEKRGPGAPPLPPGQRKVKVGLRLHPWFMDLLRAETSGKGTQSQAELIEEGVCKLKGWSAPE